MDRPTLEEVAAARVPSIETMSDGIATTTKIWVVVVDDQIYVRSYRGERGRWYQRALVNPEVTLILDGRRLDLVAVPANDEVSIERATRGFSAKYEPSQYLDAMIAEDVLHTTMRLEPR